MIEVRPWGARDIPAILEIEDQGTHPINIMTLAEWIENDHIYGVVITEDHIVRGFMAVFLPKIPQAHIQVLRVDKYHVRRGFGTRMLLHACAGLRIWRKTSLYVDVSEWNDIARKFLTGKNGFVATIIHEYTDSHGNPADASYTFEYPPPNGWRAGTIRISTDNGVYSKSFA